VLSKLKYGVALVLMIAVFGGGAGRAMLRGAQPLAAPETSSKPPQAAPSLPKKREHVDALGDPHETLHGRQIDDCLKNVRELP
jgi:hypothetical protein